MSNSSPRQNPINCQNGQLHFVEMAKNISSSSTTSSFVQSTQNIPNKQQKTIIEQEPQQRVLFFLN